MFPTNTEQGLWVYLNVTKALMQEIADLGSTPHGCVGPCPSCKARQWITSYEKLYHDAELAKSNEPWPPPNDMNSYQSWATARAAEAPLAQQLSGLALGMAGESGEVLEALGCAITLAAFAGKVADTSKKITLHGKAFSPEMRERLIAEVGDVFWYVAAFADRVLGIPLSEIAEANVAKLTARSRDAKYAASNPLVPSAVRCHHTRPLGAQGCLECLSESQTADE